MDQDRRRSGRVRAVVTVDTGSAAPASPVFVLVHGIGVSSRYFERLVPALAAFGRVVAIDLPGFGRARPKPAHAPGIEGFADVVAEVLDRLGLVRCILVGHSMGTQIVIALAKRRPDLAAAVALLGPVMAPRDRRPVRAALLLGLDTLRESPRGNAVVIGDYLKAGPRWYLANLPAMLEYRTEEEVADLSVPVLVVRGARDPIARDGWVAALAARARRGRAESVPGPPHLVMHGAPYRTAELLGDLARSAVEAAP
jgi:pimeloyl-ACP methyl ester carboxylesterase